MNLTPLLVWDFLKKWLLTEILKERYLHIICNFTSYTTYLQPLPSNIFLVAACNPHRGNSLAIYENKDEHKAETWIRGSYYVQKLHPTLKFLMWDYGSLNKEQELAYVEAKMIMVNEDFGM